MIVNFKHRPDEAMRGVLWQYRGGWLTLREAEALKAGSPPTPVDGDVTLHQSNVAYFQVLPT